MDNSARASKSHINPPSALPITINRRPRAPTIDYQIPQPENHPSKYTRSRIERALIVAEARLGSKTRKPCPSLEKLLLLYRGACRDFLQEFPISLQLRRLSAKSECLKEICAIKNGRNLRPTMRLRSSTRSWSNCAASLTSTITGTTSLILLTLLRANTRKEKTEEWEEVSERLKWGEVASRLRAETNDWNRYGTSKGLDLVKTSNAVYKGCSTIGLDFKVMRTAITSYGDRNELLYSPMFQLVADGNFAALARLIHEDIHDLPKVMPAGMADEESALLAILLECRDRCFVTVNNGIDDTHNPAAWIPRAALIDERKHAVTAVSMADVK